ncbi:hypothetical protein O6H91_12G031400 [Diphasiastrum complanatum]|nr:hypothetical protein O6H91_12G031400 [Diphasiastrum complanatum]
MFANPINSKAVLDIKLEFKPAFAAGISTALTASASCSLRAPASVSSPDLSYPSAGATISALAPLSGAASSLAEAPKRKRPYVRLQADVGDSAVEGRLNKTATFGASKVEPDQAGQVRSTIQSCLELDRALAVPNEAVTASSPNARASSSMISFPSNLESALPATVPQQNASDKVSFESNIRDDETDIGTSCSTEKDLKFTLLPDKDNSASLAAPASLVKEVDVSKSSLCADASLSEHNLSRSSLPSPAKLGIDLMAFPLEGNERSSEHSGAVVGDVQETGNSLRLEKQTVAIVERRNDKGEKANSRGQVGEAILEQNILKQKHKEEQKGRELIESSNQHPPKDDRHVKTKVRAEKAERSGTSHQSSAGVSTSLLDRGSRDPPPLSVSRNIPRWSGVLPTLGYYGPAAAAAAAAAVWPGVASLAKAPVDGNNSNFQLPCYATPPRQSWKRCASHIYIAHFISIQQQVAQHPFFAAMYGNPAGLYGAKPYLPLPPTDSIYGTAAGAFIDKNAPGASSSANMLLSADEGGGLGIASLRDKDFRAAALAALPIPGAKETAPASYTDALLRISLQQQAQSEEHQSSNPVSISAGTGKTGPDSTPTADSEAVVGRGVSITTNSTAVSMASAQAQYLQAIIQHNTFPFIFPPHFGSPSFSNTSGHVGQQQPPQFFNSPYFRPQPPTNVPVGLVAQQKQQKPQGLHTFSSTGSSVQQQHSSEISPPQVEGQRAEDSTVIGTNASTESKHLSLAQRSVYGHTPSNAQVASTIILSSPIATASTQAKPVHQDFGHNAFPGSKQNCKSQQQQQLAPVQQQPQPLSGLPSHSLSSQVLAAACSPGFSLGLKGLELQSSQAFHGMPITNRTRGSIGPGPLGLAPVAAVMAPEGHALLPNMVDSMKSHTQYQQSKLQHSHHLKHGNQVSQQHNRSVPVQRSATGADEVRSGIDSNSYGMNSREDRKSAVTRALGSTPLPRVEFETQLNTSNSNSINIPPSLPLCNGRSTLSSAMTLPSHPSGKMLSVSLLAPNVLTNENTKPTAPRGKATPSQSMVVSSTSSVLPSTDRASPAPTFIKSPPPGLSFQPSGHSAVSNSQRQAQNLQHAPVKSSQRPSEGPVPGASDSSQGSSLAAGKSHLQQSRNPATGATQAPRVPSPALSTSGATPPLPPVSKSPSNNPSKGAGTGKSSLHATQKASTASGKRFVNAGSNVGTTPPQNMTSKTQLQAQQAQQVQASQQQSSIFPTSYQQSPLAQHYQQHQSHLAQQQVQQSQKQSSQQQQQIRQPIFLQQQQHYLQQQHHQQKSPTQVLPKNQQNQAILHQTQQQHLGVKPPFQSQQQGSISQQQVLQHLQQQKHHQQALPSALSNLGSKANPYPGSLAESPISDENGQTHGSGSRQNQSGSPGITGAYLQPGTNSGARKTLEQTAAVDGLHQEQLNGNLSVACSSPSKSSTSTASASTFDSPAAKIISSVTPNKFAVGQSSGVNFVENVSLSMVTASVRTSSVTASNNSTKIPSLSNDGVIKGLGPYLDSNVGSNGRVSVGGTSASLQQGAVCSVQPNIPSAHQVSLSTAPGTSINVSSNVQAG